MTAPSNRDIVNARRKGVYDARNCFVPADDVIPSAEELASDPVAIDSLRDCDVDPVDDAALAALMAAWADAWIETANMMVQEASAHSSTDDI